MVNLGVKVAYLYPDAEALEDYEVRDSGSGPEIVRWDENSLGPLPTGQQLQDAALPALKAQKRAEIRSRVVSECEALMPVYEMLYLMRSRTNDSRLSEMDAIAKKGRDLEAAVKAAKTEAEVEALTW